MLVNVKIVDVRKLMLSTNIKVIMFALNVEEIQKDCMR